MQIDRSVQLLNYAGESNRWSMARAQSHPMLRGFVGAYTDYHERTGAFSARRELASTEAVLLFNLGEPIEIIGADGVAITVGQSHGFVGGIADATSISRSRGSQSRHSF